MTFGRSLEQTRTEYLDQLQTCADVLILGEGDGRFLQQLLRANPHCRVDVVERSRRMVELSARRVPCDQRVRFFQQDVATFRPTGRYDAIVTLFFLDCFEEPELQHLVEQVGSRLRLGGRWLYADFQSHRLSHQVIVNALYAAFNSLTDIRARKLSDPRDHFRAQGMRLRRRQERCGGLLCAELWQRASGYSPPSRGTPKLNC